MSQLCVTERLAACGEVAPGGQGRPFGVGSSEWICDAFIFYMKLMSEISRRLLAVVTATSAHHRASTPESLASACRSLRMSLLLHTADDVAMGTGG